jgi:peptidoglycan-associated lipoprotein
MFFPKTRSATARIIAISLILPFLAAGKCKPEPPPPPPPPPPQEVKVAVQVVSISPSKGAPNQAFPAKIMGSGFRNGATVRFGNLDGEKVQVSDENTIRLNVPALPVGAYDVIVTNPNGENSTLRGGLTIKSTIDACQFARVNFAFDSSVVDSSAQSELNGKMSCYQSGRGPIKIEGHCDERGTIDYNLALGQRRADATRRYLTNGGVSSSRVTTVSYGKEKPLDSGHSETAWSKNRRADLHASE